MKHRFKLMLLAFLLINIGCKENQEGAEGSFSPVPDKTSPVSESPDGENSEPEKSQPEEKPSEDLNGAVKHILHLKDGSLVIYGDFSSYGDQQTSSLIKLDENKQLHQVFSNNIQGLSGQVHGLKELQGGLIALYGYRIAMNQLPENALLVLDSDAQPFTPLTNDDAQRIDGEIFDLEQDSSGNLHLAGNFKAMTSGGIANLAVLNLKGQLLNSYRKLSSDQEKGEEIVEEIRQHIADADPLQQNQDPQLDPLPEDMDLVLEKPSNENRSPAATPGALPELEGDAIEDSITEEFVSDSSDENKIDQIIEADDDSENLSNLITIKELNSFLSVYKDSYKNWTVKKASLLKFRNHKKRVKNNLKKHLKVAKDRQQKKQLRARWKSYVKSYKIRAKSLKKELAVLKNQFKARQKTLKKFAKANAKALKKEGVHWKNIKIELKAFKKEMANKS